MVLAVFGYVACGSVFFLFFSMFVQECCSYRLVGFGYSFEGFLNFVFACFFVYCLCCYFHSIVEHGQCKESIILLLILVVLR